MTRFEAPGAPLAAIERAWGRVDGGGVTVVLTGPAGVGKSRLAAEALDRLRPEPGAVVLGHARPTPAPYDWLATALARRGVADLPASAEALAWLTHSPDAPTLRWEPTVLLRVAVTVVRHLLADAPGVLVVEDTHALDPASLALIGELACGELPVLTLILSRPTDTERYPKAAARLLKTLDETGRLDRLDLDPAAAESLGPGGAVWARYATALGRRDLAAPAALRGAAALLETGEADAARGLLEECLGEADEPAADEPRLLLARSLLHLGRITAAADVAARAEGPQAAALSRTLRVVTDLTAREREVLSCLAAGMSNRQVARSLDISVRTVTVHVSNLLRKTGSGSRTEAALWAVEHGLTGDVP